MKRAAIAALCLSLLVTGCFKSSGEQRETTDMNVVIQEEHDTPVQEELAQPKRLVLDETWSDARSPSFTKSAWQLPHYTAQVTDYNIAGNLSNVVNMERFKGFTDEQRAMLANNGFVVLPSQDTKMYYVYDRNEYEAIPNFITADAVLHLFHHFYDKSLMMVESNALYDDLRLMSEQMLMKSIQLYDALEDEQLRALQANNVVFFLVAYRLMEPSAPMLEQVSAALWELAEQELAKIDEAEAFGLSPLLRVDLDYSQFKVRGHYTRDEKLGRFFRAMIWLGTAPLPFYDNEHFLYDNVLQALLIAFTTFLESDQKSDALLWLNIYGPTSQYVGLSDDIHVFAMNELRLSVYGEGDDPNIFNDPAYYDNLKRAVQALPEPRIQGKLTTVSLPAGKQFRYMGQRYVLDSYIMQELMEPFLRPLPSGLDVMGVLGSDTAERLLFDVYKPQDTWPKYAEVYRALEAEAAAYTEDTWTENIYNGWLWSIQEAMNEFPSDSGMPWFMTTEAWRHKSLNTALGSYAELKHDTVLYGKQPVAQSGGPMDVAKFHYVEPNVPLYSKLMHLTDDTLELLEDRGMLNDAIRSGANLYRELLQILIDCSIKQLRNEALTEEQYDELLWFGARFEHITNSLMLGISEDYSTIELSDMLVADVATIAPRGNLSLGTGFYDTIYVIVPHAGELYLTRGAVYAYYEFYSDERLTDEEWWEMNGLKKVQADFGSYLELTEPSPSLPDQPSWVHVFKSDRNLVEVELFEVDWHTLNE